MGRSRTLVLLRILKIRRQKTKKQKKLFQYTEEVRKEKETNLCLQKFRGLLLWSGFVSPGPRDLVNNLLTTNDWTWKGYIVCGYIRSLCQNNSSR